MEAVTIDRSYLVATTIMNDVLNYWVSRFFQFWELSFAVKESEYTVLGCLFEYRVYIANCLVPNYGVDYYRGVGKKVGGGLQKSSRLGVKSCFCLVVHGIGRLIGRDNDLLLHCSSRYLLSNWKGQWFVSDKEVSEEKSFGSLKNSGSPWESLWVIHFFMTEWVM